MTASTADTTGLNTSGERFSYGSVSKGPLKTEADIEMGDTQSVIKHATIRRRTCICSILLVVALLLYVASHIFAYKMIAIPFVATAEDYQQATVVYNPENALTDHALEELQCQEIRDVFRKTATAAMLLAKKEGWKKIYLPSRHAEHVEDATLTAYYYPSIHGPKESPTVVVQHGNNVNINDQTVQTAGFFLRLAGYNVLMPNFRNHGGSDRSHHNLISWGTQEVYDILGAWDYAVHDPDGIFGGPKDPSHVGLMGFSMGGYISKVAFGMEPRIPALFTDGAVQDKKELLKYFMDQKLFGQSWLLLSQTWSSVKKLVGDDIETVYPAATMPKHPNNRKVANVHAADDDKVPIEQSYMYKNMLEEIGKGGSKYQLVQEWYTETVLPGMGASCKAHCRMHLTHPQQYCKFLCEFFTDVFQNGEKARCSNVCKFD